MVRRVDGLYWPESDIHGLPAIFGLVSDIDKALTFTRSRNACLQAGGNCGVWAASLATSFAEVWTVEPDLENYLCLIRNVPANVRPIWAALGNGPGSVNLCRDRENIGAHYVHDTGRIPVLTIDELQLPSCDLIILDIEGMEPLALEGAKQTIAKFHPVLMVEDKGLSERYGFPKGWSKEVKGYRNVMQAHSDYILIPD